MQWAPAAPSVSMNACARREASCAPVRASNGRAAGDSFAVSARPLGRGSADDGLVVVTCGGAFEDVAFVDPALRALEGLPRVREENDPLAGPEQPHVDALCIARRDFAGV